MPFAWRKVERRLYDDNPNGNFLFTTESKKIQKASPNIISGTPTVHRNKKQLQIPCFGPLRCHKKRKQFQIFLYLRMFLNLFFLDFTYSLLFHVYVFPIFFLLLKCIWFYILPVIPIKLRAFPSFFVVTPSSNRLTAPYSHQLLVKAFCQPRISLSVGSAFHLAQCYPSVLEISFCSVPSARSVQLYLPFSSYDQSVNNWTIQKTKKRRDDIRSSHFNCQTTATTCLSCSLTRRRPFQRRQPKCEVRRTCIGQPKFKML